MGIQRVGIVLVVAWWIGCLGGAGYASDQDWASARMRMVRDQIEARGVRTASVLAAMARVPRHRFVPKTHRLNAYGDYPLPIGHRQTISQPYIVALMTELAGARPGDRVLEVGTGSGYQAAVLAETGAIVYTIEILPELGKRAARLLGALGYAGIHARIGDGYKGWPDAAPFNAILVTCAPTRIPAPLVHQLADGGRMVIPVGEAGAQQLIVMTKQGDRLTRTQVIPVRFVPMVDDQGRPH